MEAAGEFATTLGHTGLITWPQLQALEKLLDAHAHELTEKIRANAYAHEFVSYERLAAADLIDPEATP